MCDDLKKKNENTKIVEQHEELVEEMENINIENVHNKVLEQLQNDITKVEKEMLTEWQKVNPTKAE